MIWIRGEVSGVKNVYDAGGCQELLRMIRTADDYCGQICRQLENNEEIGQVRTVCDIHWLMDEYEGRLRAHKRRLESLYANMKTHFEQLDEAAARGNTAFGDEGTDWGEWDIGTAAAAVSYSGYASWDFAQSGQSLSEDFNDLDGFFHTSAYKRAWEMTGISEWANTDLYLQFFAGKGAGALDALFGTELSGQVSDYADKYVDELLESALADILENLPDVKPEWDISGLTDTVSSLSGIDDLDKWAKQLASFLKKCAEDGMTSEEILDSADAWELIQNLSYEERKVFREMFKKVYEAGKLSGKISDAVDAAGIIDDCVEVLVHCLNDYSGQVAYLEAMENGILAAGFPDGPVTAKLQEMKRIYQSDFLKAMDVLGGYAWGEAVGAGKKTLLDAVSGSIPIVKSVDFGLKVVDTAADIAFADEIKAVKGLSGLRQYDYALTKSYQRYEALMEAGTATDADMREADKLFRILKATKAKEYEYTMDLCEDTDLTRYEYYKAKYSRLTS